MSIGAISAISSITPAFNPALAAKTVAIASSTLPALATSVASTPAQPSPAQSTAPAGTPALRAHRGGGHAAAPAPVASSTASAVEQLIGSYSTTVAGQQYAGTVEESNGVYTVSVPNVPGATATGNSEIAAENNLDNVIDEIV